jgi:hypothetical protein
MILPLQTEYTGLAFLGQISGEILTSGTNLTNTQRKNHERTGGSLMKTSGSFRVLKHPEFTVL